jgi:hypothetical protein
MAQQRSMRPNDQSRPVTAKRAHARPDAAPRPQPGPGPAIRPPRSSHLGRIWPSTGAGSSRPLIAIRRSSLLFGSSKPAGRSALSETLSSFHTFPFTFSSRSPPAPAVGRSKNPTLPFLAPHRMETTAPPRVPSAACVLAHG